MSIVVFPPQSGGGSASIADATDTTAGKIRIATSGESTAGTNTVTAMTPALVQAKINAAVSGGVEYKGSFNAATATPSLVTALKGDLYLVSHAGTFAGIALNVNDHIVFNQNAADPVTSSMFDVIDNTSDTSLQKSQNLGDLDNLGQAQTNLGLATVATSGDYSDLSNKPTLGTAAAKAAGSSANEVLLIDGAGKIPTIDGSQLTNVTAAASDITGLATVATTGAYADISGTPTLATVATSGDYSDLSNKPTLGTAAAKAAGSSANEVLLIDGAGKIPTIDGSQLTNVTAAASDITGLATVATTGAYADISGTPTLATVATSGDYSDLSNKPTLGTAAAKAAGSSANEVLLIDGAGKIPAIDGSQITNVVADLVFDTSPQLGGDLDVNSNDIISVSNGAINLAPNGTGKVTIKGNTDGGGSGQLVLNCEQNSHGITIKGPPHSANATYTLTLPNDDGDPDQVLKTDGSGNLDWVDQSGGGTPKLNDIATGDAASELKTTVGNITINAASTNSDILFKNQSLTMLSLDSSAGGDATFSGSIDLSNAGESLKFQSGEVEILHKDNAGLTVKMGAAESNNEPIVEVLAQGTNQTGPSIDLHNSGVTSGNIVCGQLRTRKGTGNTDIIAQQRSFWDVTNARAKTLFSVHDGNGLNDALQLLGTGTSGAGERKININGMLQINGVDVTDTASDLTDFKFKTLATVGNGGAYGISLGQIQSGINLDFQGARLLNLPAASTVPAGQVFGLVKTSGTDKLLTVSPNGSDTLDGAASNQTFRNKNSWAFLMSNGTNGFITLAGSKYSNTGKTYEASSASSITAQENYHYSIDSSSNTVNIALPELTETTAGQEITVKLKTAGNNVTLTAYATGKQDTIDGANTKVISVLNTSLTLVSDGSTNWEIV